MNRFAVLLHLMAVSAVTIFLAAGCNRHETTAPAEPAASEPTLAAAVTPDPMPGPQFLEAAFGGKVDVVRTAVERGARVNWTDENGRTALMLSAFNGHSDVVQSLLNADAKIDLRDPTGRTALMFASTIDSTDTIRMLLENGADVNAVDAGEKWTALMFAAAEGHQGVVRLLLDHGANPRTTDVDGDDAAAFAVQRGHRELARMLQEAGQKE